MGSWKALMVIAALAGACVPFVAPAGANEVDTLDANVIFVISTGFWAESIEPAAPGGAIAAEPQPLAAEAAPAAGEGEPAVSRRGYYKIIALRQPDGTSRIHLQQIVSGSQGPSVLSSTELEEFAGLKAYVTDVRPETSTGIVRQPGLFATVYLKTDPAATEPDAWTILIDDLGDIRVERATN